MERRVFIAVLLSFAVLYGYQALFVPPPQEASPSTTTGTSVPVGASSRPGDPSSPAATRPEAAPAVVEGPSVEALVSENAPREIVVETRDAEIVLSNQGARVLHWRLKSY